MILVRPRAAMGATMADPKSPKAALTHALAMALAGAGTWFVGHAVSPANAEPMRTGSAFLATAAQVEVLSNKIDDYRAEVKAAQGDITALKAWRIRLEAIEEERERAGGTRNAVGRSR